MPKRSERSCLPASLDCDLATVSRLLEHTSISTTEVYADVQMESKVAAIANMKGLFD